MPAGARELDTTLHRIRAERHIRPPVTAIDRKNAPSRAPASV
jgi:hypothetical protein